MASTLPRMLLVVVTALTLAVGGLSVIGELAPHGATTAIVDGGSVGNKH